MIEDIEQLGSELHRELLGNFRDFGVFGEGEVRIDNSRTCKHVSAQISQHTEGRKSEGGWIEPLVGTSCDDGTRREARIQVRPLRALPKFALSKPSSILKCRPVWTLTIPLMPQPDTKRFWLNGSVYRPFRRRFWRTSYWLEPRSQATLYGFSAVVPNSRPCEPESVSML